MSKSERNNGKQPVLGHVLHGFSDDSSERRLLARIQSQFGPNLPVSSEVIELLQGVSGNSIPKNVKSRVFVSLTARYGTPSTHGSGHYKDGKVKEGVRRSRSSRSREI